MTERREGEGRELVVKEEQPVLPIHRRVMSKTGEAVGNGIEGIVYNIEKVLAKIRRKVKASIELTERDPESVGELVQRQVGKVLKPIWRAAVVMKVIPKASPEELPRLYSRPDEDNLLKDDIIQRFRSRINATLPFAKELEQIAMLNFLKDIPPESLITKSIQSPLYTLMFTLFLSAAMLFCIEFQDE